MGWAGHKARMGEILIGCSVGKLEEKSSLQDPDVDGMMIVKCGFKK
jgi:triosephosphate isomerase